MQTRIWIVSLPGDSRKYWQRSGGKGTGIKGKPLQKCSEQSLLWARRAPCLRWPLSDFISRALSSPIQEGWILGYLSTNIYSIIGWWLPPSTLAPRNLSLGFIQTEHRENLEQKVRSWQSEAVGVPESSGCWGRDGQNSCSICYSVPEPPSVWGESLTKHHRKRRVRIWPNDSGTWVIIPPLVFCLPLWLLKVFQKWSGKTLEKCM